MKEYKIIRVPGAADVALPVSTATPVAIAAFWRPGDIQAGAAPSYAVLSDGRNIPVSWSVVWNAFIPYGLTAASNLQELWDERQATRRR